MPPVDVSPTGNTVSYEPQPVTEAPEDWRQEPAAQFRGGMLAGVALGLVPFAGIGEQILDKADVLPQTSYFRQGAAIGQIFGGLASIPGRRDGWSWWRSAATTEQGTGTRTASRMESAAETLSGGADRTEPHVGPSAPYPTL